MATVAHAPDLVERDRELAVPHALLADAAVGRGRVTLIEGPAGIGRSRLLGARAAAPGARARQRAALFVKPKTVDVHLSSADRKLGIASRRALSGVLAHQT